VSGGFDGVDGVDGLDGLDALDGDDGRVRGFAPFPPRRDRQFATSWWGRAWISAMEEASLDVGRLSRGRTYARKGVVGPIVVRPGRFSARVQGSREEPYRVEVLIDELTDAEWTRFLDTVAAQAGHVAALLEREMPHDLVESAMDAGVRLLPALGDLDPSCSCPDDGYPCKHAAALCYQASRLLDEDPFVLLLMRGRGERELVAELQRRNVPVGEDAGDAGSGAPPVAAAEAFAAATAGLPELPPVPEVPAGDPARLDVPAADGVDPAALRLLAADAALRAREALGASAADGDVRVLDEFEDAVRMAAAHRDADLWARLGTGAGERFDRAVWAWSCGGAAGVDVLAEAWSPSPAEVARGRGAVTEWFGAGEAPGVAVWRNRWTVAEHGVQLRLGRDGRWYPYRHRSGDWWPAGPPSRDPSEAVADLLTP
jgi:uncharacterized Zn finger protein